MNGGSAGCVGPWNQSEWWEPDWAHARTSHHISTALSSAVVALQISARQIAQLARGTHVPCLPARLPATLLATLPAPPLPLQVATDALVSMERAMARDGILTNDRQLACARINSQVGCYVAGCYVAAVQLYLCDTALHARKMCATARSLSSVPPPAPRHSVALFPPPLLSLHSRPACVLVPACLRLSVCA